MVVKPEKKASTKVKNIVISGTNFWNPGDDFVRDGVIKILENLFRGYQLNFLFYNFNQDFFPQSKFTGITNMAAKGDLNKYAEQVDAVVIAGLSAGLEINDLYNWIIDTNLLDRVYLIGAGYENDYVDNHISLEPAATIFKNARVLTGRTRKKPKFISAHNLPYHHVNCPAILSVPNVKNISESKRIQKIAFSIQLPHQFGILNHSCDESMHKLAMNILFALYHDYEIEVIAHHKSEYFYFVKLFQELGLSVSVIFSSFYQDMFNIYRKQDLIIATRLHACLYGNGHGIPGIVLNDTDRHTHCLDGFPHSVWVNSKGRFDSAFSEIKSWNFAQVAEEAEKFKDRLLNQYLYVLAEAFGVTIEKMSKSEDAEFSGQLQMPSKDKCKDQKDSCIDKLPWVSDENGGKFKNIFTKDLAALLIDTIAGDVDTKHRVLNIFNRLTKDYWLEKNIENYRRLIQNRVSCFDAASFINWYAEHFKPRTYVEIGVRRGRSLTQVLIQSPETSAFGFDMWIPDYGSKPEEGINTSNPGPEFVLQELRNLGCGKLPTLYKGDSHLTLPQFWSDNKNPQQIDLIFVDGDHTYAGAKRDLDICFQHLADGGALVFDDITHPSHPELKRLWEETKARFPDYIFVEHSSGMGTGLAFKPPFDKLKRVLSKDISCPFPQKVSKIEDNGAVVKSANAKLPVHFFTIVLNGEPFIRHHIEVFKRLSFRWHWHLIEGVADLKHDTAWSLQNGGRISDKLHRCGLSNDGTTKYIDALEREYPENITIYRKPGGLFWSGKLEMVNAPLENIYEECLLWQVDADELWTGEQINTCRALFMAEPDRTAAYFLDHFFVGEDLTITTIDTYGNNTAYEWLRTWRFKPGFRWTAHEPPRLCMPAQDGQWIDIATIEPFKHNETAVKKMVFQHYAYATESQLRFKDIYYGYKDGIEGWRALQKQSNFPVYLREYFPWVKDAAQVDTIASQNIKPLACKDHNNQWQFSPYGLAPEQQPTTSPAKCMNILFVRTDSIGDNILAMAMIPHITGKYPMAKITVLCQEHVAELYEVCPFVDDIVKLDKQRSYDDEEYRLSIIQKLQAINADLTLNSVYSREPLTDVYAIGSGAKERIAFNGDLCNISAEIRDKHNQFYSKILPNGEEYKRELDRHSDFLKALGIEAQFLQPIMWLTPEDEEFADDFFTSNKLQPEKTIALFAGAQNELRIYRHYGRALSQICNENDFTVITFGSKTDYEINRKNLDAIGKRTINLCGKTTLRQAAVLLKQCRLAVGAETGIAHIACAVGTPNVILLGGGHFGRFMPYSALTSVVCLPLECYSCNWQCQYQKAYCISDISPDVIIEALRQTLKQTSKIPRVFVQTTSIWNSGEEHPEWKALGPDLGLGNVEIIPVNAELHSKKYLISAIVSTYNSERFIRGCLEDLENQTIADRLEIVIVNSGSQQNEEKIIKEFQKKYSNIKYIKTTQRESVYAAWNRGIRAASGTYITNANTDDRHRPDALEVMVRALEENPTVGAVYADNFITDKANETFENNSARQYFNRPNFSLRQMLLFSFFGPQPMWRRSVHRKIGYFDPNLSVAGDYDFFIRLSREFGALHIGQILGLYNRRIRSIENSNREKCVSETLQVLKHYRNIIPLEELYPDLKSEKEPGRARAACLADQGNCCLFGDLPDIEGALVYYSRSLEHGYTEPELAANLAVAFLLSGNQTQGIEILRGIADKVRPAAHNLAVINKCIGKGELPSISQLKVAEIRHPAVLAATHGKGLIIEKNRFIPFESVEKHWIGSDLVRNLPCKTKGMVAERPRSALVSVIVRTMNRTIFLEECLTSLAAQAFTDFEVILINDGGKNVDHIIDKYSQRLHILYKEHPTNKGRTVALNTGLNSARGKYIAYLDDDDRIYPDHFEILTTELETGRFPVVYSDSLEVSQVAVNGTYKEVRKRLVHSLDFDRDLLRRTNYIPILNLMHRRDCVEKIGLFDENLTVLEDWDYWIRLSEYYDFKHISKVTAEYRVRSDNSNATAAEVHNFPDCRQRIRAKRDAIAGRSTKSVENPLVSIVILTCNQLEYTRKCLDSILELTKPSFEIIVVDNGSIDGTPEVLDSLLEGKLPSDRLKVIRNKENRGFAAGNNQGIATARGDYILLMNNDIVVTPGWLERMLSCAERDPKIGIVGPMSNSVSGPQLFKDVTYSIGDLEGLDEFALEFSKRNAGKAKRILRVVGFCMLFKRAVVDKIGGLDDRYGLGNFEDDDFSLRAALAGFESWMAEDCFIHHFGNRTFIGANIDYNASLAKNWEIFKKKWGFPADLQLGSKYSWAHVLKSGCAREKLYCSFIQRNSNETDPEADSSPWPADDRLEEIYQKVQQLVHDGGREEAIAALEKLVEKAPEFARAHNDLGVLYYNRGDKEKAVDHYEQAVRLEPQNLNFKKNLADFYFVESSRVEEALAIYNKVLEVDAGDVEALMSIGLICEAMDRREDAGHFYSRVLEHEPRNVDAQKRLENLYPN